MENKKLTKSMIGLVLLTFISKILGFAREMVISYMYGASSMSDAYSMTNSVAVLIVTGIASGIMTAYIPASVELRDKEKQDKFTCNVLNTTFVGSGILGVICLIFSNQIVAVLGMGFAESTKYYTTVLLRFVIGASICILLIYIISGYLNIRQNFFYGGIQLVITNLIIIVAILVSNNNSWILGGGYLLAYIVPTFIGGYLLRKYKLIYKWQLNFADTRLKQLYLASMIAFLGTNVVKIDIIIDRVFASSLPEGTVSALNYAFTLISICPEIFIMSIVTVGYPKLSEWFVRGEEKLAGSYIKNMLINTEMILLPVTVVFLEMGEWIIQILFQRGAFNASDTLLTVDILNGYSYGMLGIGVSFVLCKVFLAYKKKWVLALCLGIGICMNLICNVIVGQAGAYQIALTTSISITVSTVLMLIILVRKYPQIDLKGMGISGVKILIAVLLMKLVLTVEMKVCIPLESQSVIVKLMILALITVIALIVYVFVLYLSHVEELRGKIAVLKQKFKR